VVTHICKQTLSFYLLHICPPHLLSLSPNDTGEHGRRLLLIPEGQRGRKGLPANPLRLHHPQFLPRLHQAEGTAAGAHGERDGGGLGTYSSFSTPPYAVPHSALLCSAEAHIGGVRVGGRDDLVDPEWVRGPHHGGGLHGQGRR
jgi:hypothetical protein